MGEVMTTLGVKKEKERQTDRREGERKEKG